MTNNDVQKIISETAEATAAAIYKKMMSEQAKQEKNAFSKRLYNTKLLLQNYRLFKDHIDNAVFELTRIDEEQETAAEILDAMWQTSGPGKGEIAVESIKKSITRTKIIMEHINEMLKIFELYSITSGKELNVRRWHVINKLYILDTKKTSTDIIDELAEEYYTDRRTIYRDIDDAVEKITALLFGIDGISKLEGRKK